MILSYLWVYHRLAFHRVGITNSLEMFGPRILYCQKEFDYKSISLVLCYYKIKLCATFYGHIFN